MSIKGIKIGELVSKYPIVQGGMGVGVSLSGLAGAVAAAGGIGVISTAQIGFSEPEFDNEPLKTNLRMIGEHIKRARKKAADGILGVNIMVATKNYAEYVKTAVDNKIDLIISGAGLPLELPKYTKGSGTKIAPIVSSIKAASVILKSWDRHFGTTADAVVVEGPNAGGHLGFKNEELEKINMNQYDEEIKGIISKVNEYGEKYDKEIPVIVAGGMENHEDLMHYIDIGAAGIQVATKFVTTYECDASDAYKQAYLNCKKEDIVIVKSPVGMLGRAIDNEFVKKTKLERIPVKKCHNCIVTCNPATTPYCITDALTNAVTGNLKEGLIFCGANAYKENRIRYVKDVINDYIL